MATSWFRSLNNLFNWVGVAGPTSAITVSSSNFTYTAPSNGWVIVNGGTVTQVAFSRDSGNTFLTTGATNGVFPVAQNDQLKVASSANPTMTMVPR